MRRQLFPAVVMLALFTLLTGVAYPLLLTGFAQVAFDHEADGSLLERDGQVVGSSLIGQAFTGEAYFHPRPATDGYASGPGSSYGSNEGPSSERFLLGQDDPATAGVDESQTSGVDDRVRAYRQDNGLPADAEVPVDAVTGSASGLDPHISVANARLQAARVARIRGLDEATVDELIDRHTDGRSLGFLGEPGVNVLELNLALDGR